MQNALDRLMTWKDETLMQINDLVTAQQPAGPWAFCIAPMMDGRDQGTFPLVNQWRNKLL